MTPGPPTDDYLHALALHRAGRLSEAAAAYRAVLARSPGDADALNGLGSVAFQASDYPAAVRAFEQAVRLRPGSPAFLSNLGLAAAACGNGAAAVAVLRQAAALAPADAKIHYNLGNAWKQQGSHEAASACYRQALHLDPTHLGARNNLANALRAVGEVVEAEACLRAVLARQPQHPEAAANLGGLLRDLGRLDEAEAGLRQALAFQPTSVAAWVNLGSVLRTRGCLAEAERCFRTAAVHPPASSEPWDNLGGLLLSQGRFDEARACYQRAVELAPDRSEGFAALGNILLTLGEIEEGDHAYRRAVELQPDRGQALSAWLYWKQYRPGVTSASLAADHQEWDRRYGRPAGPPPAARAREGGRLRFGFVSGDFGRHPVGYFSVRAVEALAERFDVACYSTVRRNDDLTARFRAAGRRWCEAHLLPDQALAAQIRADGVDVLFDLSGHTAGNRLGVFALRPAPVQVTWIGSEGTTGLSAMDYLLADRWLVPPGAEPHYRERILRLPETYVCYDPPADAPPPGPLPALRRGSFTLASFNNPAKLNDAVVAVWAEILRRLPTARLVLKYRGLCDPGMLRRWTDRFAAHGVAAPQLELRDWSPHAAMLAEYQEVDLALDPFPFGGGATTCEALWMGVPVVTWPGETFAGRHSLSYLSTVGVPDTVAASPEDYIELVCRWAASPHLLASVRARLREQMGASPLCDGRRLAGHVTAALQCAGPKFQVPSAAL